MTDVVQGMQPAQQQVQPVQQQVQPAQGGTMVSASFENSLQLAPMSTELKQQLADVDTGVKGNQTSLPRIALSGEQMKYTFNGSSTLLGNVQNAVLLGATGVVQRTYTEGKYDPNNPRPPSCFSSDGKKPDAEFAGTPIVVDRSTNQPRKVRVCSECPVGQKGGDCDWVENTVWSFPGLQESDLFHMPIKNASLFNKGDLVGNDPNQNTGYLDYATKLNAIQTPDGPMKPFRIETRIQVMRQNEQGTAFVFGPGVTPEGQLAQLDAPRLQQVAALYGSARYKELLDSKYVPEDYETAPRPGMAPPIQDQQALPPTQQTPPPVQQSVPDTNVQAPVQQAVTQAPVQSAPVQQTPAQGTPVQSAPVQQAVTQAPPQQVVTQAPAQGTPVQSAPNQ